MSSLHGCFHFFLWLALGAGTPGAVHEDLLPEKEEFLEKTKSRINVGNELLSRYTFRLTETRRDLNGEGETKKTTVKVYDVFPHPNEELTYQRLISEDGRPVSRREQEKQDRQYAKRLRKSRNQAPGKPSRRTRMVQGVFEVFEFSLRGRERIGDYQTVVIDFEPRPGAEPADRDLGMLKKFRGRVWINESDHEMVQLEAELTGTVSFGLGIAARLYEGTRMVLKRRKVRDEIWLMEESLFQLAARFLLVKPVRFEVENRYSEFRRTDVDTAVTFLQELDAPDASQ